jgi:quinol monooxygenase YgiN
VHSRRRLGRVGRPLNLVVRRQMQLSRRAFTALVMGTAALVGCRPAIGERSMYGLLVHMTATPGKRDALISILLSGIDAMPGCLSYVVARDSANPDGIWITEVWDTQASHKASLSLPSVKDAISRARPLIAGFDKQIETVPVGGYGLHAAA